MTKVKISGSPDGKHWTVEWPTPWNAPMVNVFDSFQSALARLRDIGPLIQCGIDGPREGTLTCLAKSILDPVGPFKRGEGRGDMVAVITPNGRHALVSSRTARRRYGIKKSRVKIS